MKPSTFEYTCRVTLLVKKDGSHHFCGDYRPLKLQTCQDAFLMPLIKDVKNQLGKSQWFFPFDLQSRFWQIKMALEDIWKSALITKLGLFD